MAAMPVVSRAELEASLAAVRSEIAEPAAGILGPGSAGWRVGGDLAVFIGGGRASLLQLAHPFVAFAIDHHSHTRSDVAGRFQRTFRNVFAMVYGDLDDACTAARRVHAIHGRIGGVFPHAIGRWRAGDRYEANDVDALRWVHATLVDSVLTVRDVLGDPLTAAERDRYVVELNRFAALFGIPIALRPASYAAHIAYMRAMIDSDELAVAPCAREMARFLFGGRRAQPPLGAFAEHVTAALLPPRFVREFGLRDSRMTRAGVRAALRAIGPFYRRLPHALVAVPGHANARRRLVGLPPTRLSAWTERQLFGLARRTAGPGEPYR
jgi:uncharacterized protein (DUF2236 family)